MSYKYNLFRQCNTLSTKRFVFVKGSFVTYLINLYKQNKSRTVTWTFVYFVGSLPSEMELVTNIKTLDLQTVPFATLCNYVVRTSVRYNFLEVAATCKNISRKQIFRHGVCLWITSLMYGINIPMIRRNKLPEWHIVAINRRNCHFKLERRNFLSE